MDSFSGRRIADLFTVQMGCCPDIFLRAVRPGFNNEAHVAIKDAKPVLVFNNWSKIWGVLGSKSDLVWTDPKSVEAACSEAQRESDVLIRE